MLARQVGDALRGARLVPRARAQAVSAAMVPGGELVHLGGGELVPTPRVPDLPTSDADRARGLCGESLALPPANVRILRDVQILVGANVLRTRSGALVVESLSAERHPQNNGRPSGLPTIERAGNAALYGGAVCGTFESLVEAFPRALLLRHPALRNRGQVRLLFAGPTTLVEEFLLDRLQTRLVRLERLPAGTTVQPGTTFFPAPVTRSGGGALPRWYRRWLDAQAGPVPTAEVGRKLLLTHGPGDAMFGALDAWQEATDRGFTPVDTLTGAVDGDGTLDGPELVAALHDATDVLGASDDALGHAAICRKAQLVQLGTRETVSPRVAQLAASRALPYQFVRSGELGAALATG